MPTPTLPLAHTPTRNPAGYPSPVTFTTYTQYRVELHRVSLHPRPLFISLISLSDLTTTILSTYLSPPTNHTLCYYAPIQHISITYSTCTNAVFIISTAMAHSRLIQGSFSLGWKLVKHGINCRVRRVFSVHLCFILLVLGQASEGVLVFWESCPSLSPHINRCKQTNVQI